MDKENIIQSGVSDELVGILNGIRDIPDRYGRLKYPAKYCDKLNQSILCRNFHRELLQLGHLIIAVSTLENDTLESFFWNEEYIHQDAVQQCFFDAVEFGGITCELTEGFISLTYPDGEVFRISAKKVWYLSIWIEFLANFLTPDMLEDMILTMVAAGSTKQARSHYLNQVNKACADFLENHLKSLTDHRKFHFILKYFDASKAELNDLEILNFWCENALCSDHDFLMYSTVGQTLCHFQSALEIGSTQLDLSQNAEIMDHHLTEICQTKEDVWKILHEEPVSNIKFLNDKELSRIEILLASKSNHSKFPLTMVRMATFGLHQNRLREAKRRKRHAKEFLELIQCRNIDADYQDYWAMMDKTMASAEKALLGSLHILLSCQHPEALGFLHHHIPDTIANILAELTGEEGWHENNNLDHAEAVVMQSTFKEKLQAKLVEMPEDDDPQTLTAMAFYRSLPTLRQSIAPLNELLIAAGKAYSANNRQGFTEDVGKTSPLAQSHIMGRDALISIITMISSHKNKGKKISDTEKYRSDLSIFKDMYAKLYGDML